METTYEINETLDVKGLMCPMPLVKARQAVNNLEVGQVLKIVATDRGSVKDFQGWASAARNVEILQQTEDTDGDTKLYIHVIRRSA